MAVNKKALLAGAAALAVVLSGCAGAGGAGGGGGEGDGKALNVLMVGNPQMKDLEKLVKTEFSDKSGIPVNITILPENELRDKVAQDISTKAGQYDVVTIGAYEASTWTENNWLTDMTPYAEKDEAFDTKDLLPAMTGVLSKEGKMYGVPFYGESAFTMYRKDLFDKHGLKMPAEPTWTDIKDLAAKIQEKEKGVSGVCMRGLPGWGENMAVVGSMIGAFGGGFFDKDYNSLVASPETKKAVEFYVDLVTKYGESGAAQAGFTECLNNFSQGKSAIWFDATSAANSVENPKASTVVGKVGYADAPKDVRRSAWVWAWAWGVPTTTKNVDNAWKFISWASSKDYEKLAGAKYGWTAIPDGKRKSTFDIPEYKEATKAYSEFTKKAIEASDPTNCVAKPAPAPGCQYLAIPEFADMGTKIGQEVSAAVAGNTTVAEALKKAEAAAQEVAAKKKK